VAGEDAITFNDDLRAEVTKIFSTDPWTQRNGNKVPEPADLKLRNDAVILDEATVLYADLSDSTGLVQRYRPHFATEVYKSYLHCSAKITRAKGGVITAYDGDRVMGVFLGSAKNTSAVKAALKINFVVREIIQPAMLKEYSNTKYRLTQTVGIDTSSLFVARMGVRGDNDLVWVGRAANYAAKMAALDPMYPSYISEAIHNNMHETARFSTKDGRNRWTFLGSKAIGTNIYGSNWWWDN
jgi:class 3 adenylate cyclase